MAEDAPSLAVFLAPSAKEEIANIWRYNAERYNYDHAEAYEAFLVSGIEALSVDYGRGRPVVGCAELRAATIKRRARGGGHMVIYEADLEAGTLNVLHIFHTKQDVEGRLRRERSE